MAEKANAQTQIIERDIAHLRQEFEKQTTRFDRGKIKKKRKSPPPFTAEHRRRMSEAHKKRGTKPPSAKGKKRSEDCKEKIRKAKTGVKMSPEAVEKNRQARLKNPTRYWVGKKRHHMRGENHFAYKGTTPLAQSIRQSVEYKNWRTAVFERDNYTCQHCSAVGGNLHADHIVPFKYLLDKLTDVFGREEVFEIILTSQSIFDVSNGRTLCVPCHKKTKTFSTRWKYVSPKAYIY